MNALVDLPASPTLPTLPRRGAVLSRAAEWDVLRGRLAHWLAEGPAAEGFLPAVTTLAASVVALLQADPDVAVYWQLQHTAVSTRHYCASHSLTCAVVARLAADHLGLSGDESMSLVSAALTMNCAMASLQDRLAEQRTPLDDEQREAIARHPADGRQALQAAGVEDPDWLALVAHHHDAEPPLDGRLADANELLRRLDVFAAKLSRRQTRDPSTPVSAARDACLEPAGVPGRIGAAILRVLGLYPNGTWVQLANGEIGIVVRQGSRVTTPQVAAIRRPEGTTHHQPVLRNTALAACAVVQSVAQHRARIHVDHRRVLLAA